MSDQPAKVISAASCAFIGWVLLIAGLHLAGIFFGGLAVGIVFAIITSDKKSAKKAYQRTDDFTIVDDDPWGLMIHSPPPIPDSYTAQCKRFEATIVPRR
jgi:hypothetical protein